MYEIQEFEDGTPIGCDVAHWFGIKFPGLDCEGWLPYVEAVVVGLNPERKITIPLPVAEPPAQDPVMPVDLLCVYNECVSDAEAILVQPTPEAS